MIALSLVPILLLSLLLLAHGTQAALTVSRNDDASLDVLLLTGNVSLRHVSSLSFLSLFLSLKATDDMNHCAG